MKFKVGDKVRVRRDLEVGKSYNGCYFESSMAKLKGKVVEIEDLDSDSYFIKEDKYYWTKEMFSGLAEEPRNLMPLIAKELGVEMGEEFKISNKPDVYKFREDVLIGTDGVNIYNTSSTFFDLISGKEKIIKPPKLTEDEKAILRNIPKQYKYIARDNSGALYVYENKPRKDDKNWWMYGLNNLSLFHHLFQFIKWENSEPYNIKELLER